MNQVRQIPIQNRHPPLMLDVSLYVDGHMIKIFPESRLKFKESLYARSTLRRASFLIVSRTQIRGSHQLASQQLELSLL